MRYFLRLSILMSLFIVAFIAHPLSPARAADTTVSTCDFTSFTTAMSIVNTGTGGTITFACSTVTPITFTSEFGISSPISVIINANGNTVTFDGGGITRFFLVDAGASLTLNGLTLQNGNGSFGGAILNAGTLTITNSTFTGNSGVIGGAIFNDGTLDITNSTFTGNSATSGGAIANRANINSQDSHYEDNTCVNDSTGVLNDLTGNTRNTAVTSVGCPGIDPVALNVSAVACVGNNAVFTINAGDANFDITGTGAGLPITDSPATTITLTGPATWTGITVTERRGERQSVNLGDITCPGTTIPLDTYVICGGNNLLVGIVAGDTNFNITGTGPGLPVNNISTLSVINFPGPSTWTGLTITELGGDQQSTVVGDVTCPAITIPLSATATCIGADLQVNIVAGDANFNITGTGTGLPLTGVGTGLHTFTGPNSWTGVTVTELTGNAQSQNFGDFNCFVSSTLTATAVCNGANLDVTISNGNAPFSISVTDSNGVMNSGGNPLGVYTFTGPDTFSNIGITEDTGDLEVLNLPSVTCTATVVPPIVPPATSAPAVTVLGCALDATDGVEVANAPDNTYCRVLMKNGGVVSYSGAIPADLISLGVILAVDVYRLEGGTSVNNFPDYARVCLAGSGRLFYMDGRNAPRLSIELVSERVDGLTCGWIPAPGTLILTN